MSDRDTEIRLAAFARCGQLRRAHGGAVPWEAIRAGFALAGEHLVLASKARGIHRPARMQCGVLSIKTIKPRKGRTARYDDALGDDGDFIDVFQGEDPNRRDNVALREPLEDQSPLIYFYAMVPGVYDILFPCYLNDWDPHALRCSVAVGSTHELPCLTASCLKICSMKFFHKLSPQSQNAILRMWPLWRELPRKLRGSAILPDIPEDEDRARLISRWAATHYKNMPLK